MFIVYNFIYFFLLPFIVVKDILFRAQDLRFKLKRLGFNFDKCSEEHIWLHGVSLGEVRALVPIARRLSEKRLNILFSSTTDTGINEIKNSFKGEKIEIIPFPYDIGPIYKKIIKTFRVKKIILFESEFWPNMLFQKLNSIKIISLNTKLSEKTIKTLEFFHKTSKELLQNIDSFHVQSKEVYEFLTLKGCKNVSIIGNIKLYAENYTLQKDRLDFVGRKIHLFKKPILVVASTHAGEEEFVLKALIERNDFNIVIVPRHPERFKQVQRTLQQNKISTDFFADLSEEVNSVVIFNKVGYLKELYSFSALALVAGSIVFKKGHNFIEPVFCGSPVITGEFLKNYSELKKQFCDTKIIETFSNKEMLRTLVEKYSSPKKRNERLKIQKKALENLPGSYSGLIRSILDV